MDKFEKILLFALFAFLFSVMFAFFAYAIFADLENKREQRVLIENLCKGRMAVECLAIKNAIDE